MLDKNAVAAVKTQQDFMTFLSLFLTELKEHNWPNHELEDFLKAMLAWLEDADGYYEFINEPDILNQPSWRLWADMLMAARVYEA